MPLPLAYRSLKAYGGDKREGKKMKLRARLPLICAVAPLIIVGGACGSDDDGGDSSPTELEAQLSDFEFSPDSWTAAADEDVTIALTNDSQVAHEWVILQPGVEIESEADLPETEEELLADFVLTETEVEAGETADMMFNVPAGTYQIICAIEGHFDAGMEGTLTVE
jgi:uncharacterized cupredoxin-like copper-binding protein